MAEQTHIQRLRGDTAKNDAYTGVDGEFTINQDSQSIRIHDGEKKGGYGTIDAMHYAEGELPAEVPNDLRTGAHVTMGNGRLEGGDAPHAEELAGDGLIAQGGTLNVDVDNLAGDGLTSSGDALNVDLDTLDGRYVKTTGNETIDGTKTFSASPVVPTAPAGDKTTKAASTAFVDAAIAAKDGDYVKKSGDTMTGALSSNAGISSTGRMNIKDTQLVKGTNPDATRLMELFTVDKNGTSWGANGLGSIGTSVSKDGTVTTYIKACENTANSTHADSIGVSVAKDGTTSTWATTPAQNDSTNKIATTAFVERRISQPVKAFGNTDADPYVMNCEDFRQLGFHHVSFFDQTVPGNSPRTAVGDYTVYSMDSNYIFNNFFAFSPRWGDGRFNMGHFWNREFKGWATFVPRFLEPSVNLYVNAETGVDEISYWDRGHSAEKPFKTIMYAVQYLKRYFMFGVATINVAPGVYSSVVLHPLRGDVTGYVTIKGTDRDTTIIESATTGTTPPVLFANRGGPWYSLDNITVRMRSGNTAANAIQFYRQSGGFLTNVKVDFSQMTTNHRAIYVDSGSQCFIGGNIEVIGNSSNSIVNVVRVITGGQVHTIGNIVFTYSGAVTDSYVSASYSGAFNSGECTCSGTVTGRRYNASAGGSIHVNGRGENVFAGSVAGTATTGGFYG